MAAYTARLITLLAALLLAACATAPFPRGAPSSALPPGETTQLDHAVAALGLAPDESAYRLFDSGEDDFAARIQTAALAQRSLDAQYYLWHDDLTGRSIGNELLRAADRGVRVRVLLDDVTARGHDKELAELDAHEKIEIRIFNPFHSRGNFGVGMEFIFGGGRINHRMHNKLWIADSQLAIVGGRNIGDEYFGAHEEMNFGDLGVLMAGHVVADAASLFDEYWNSDSVVPISAFAHVSDPDADLAKLRAKQDAQRQQALQTPYGKHLLELRDEGALGLKLGSMLRGKQVRVVADDPAKSKGDDKTPQIMLDTITGLLQSAHDEALIISPYFVPKQVGTDVLLAMEKRGVGVQLLTNSLASNDVASVHGGYAKYRLQLLQGGVGIFELKPELVPKQVGTDVLLAMEKRGVGVQLLTNSLASNDVASVHGGYTKYRLQLLQGGVGIFELKPELVPKPQSNDKHDEPSPSSGASLHAKSVVIDRHVAFVGSFNMDPRSARINTECGVIIDDPAFATQLNARFDLVTERAHSWKLALENGKIVWLDEVDGKPVTLHDEPPSSTSKRFIAWMFRVLPLDSQL